MTDEQIIKALECCATDDGDDCFQCPYGNIVYKSRNGGCVNRCRKDALDFINRQKAKIEELHSDKIIAERHKKDARELFVDCTRQLKEAKAEIEKITEKYNCQQTVYVDLSKIIKEQAEELKQAKSEAIKEFVARLCKGRVENDPVVIATKAELDYVLGVGLEVQE